MKVASCILGELCLFLKHRPIWLSVFSAIAAANTNGQICSPQISTSFPAGDFHVGPVLMTNFDADGLEELILAGAGLKREMSGVAINMLRWNGLDWAPLGLGPDGSVSSMVVWDSDAGGPSAPALYVGGFFRNAGGIPAAGIARWDGSVWQALTGSPPNAAVWAVTIHDSDGIAGPQLPALVIADSFSEFAGAGSANIARWNGTSWSALFPVPLGGSYVLDAVSYDSDGNGPALPAVVVIQASLYSEVFRLSTQGWTRISAPQIFASHLAVLDPSGPELPGLLVSGYFDYPGVPGGAGIVRWNGSTWSALDGGLRTAAGAYGTTTRIDVFDPDGAGPLPESAFVCGEFAQAGTVAVDGLARWDGVFWHAVATQNGPVMSVGMFDSDGPGPENPRTVIGGELSQVNGADISKIAIDSGLGWEPLGSSSVGGGLSNVPKSVFTFDFDASGPEEPRLVACGLFQTAGILGAGGIAVWDGLNWQPPPFDARGYCYAALKSNLGSTTDDEMFFGGSQLGEGAIQTSGILRWNGVSLEEPGAGIRGTVLAMKTWDADGSGPLPEKLVVGGFFPAISGVPNSQNIASWDGLSWSPLGNGVDFHVLALEAFDLDGEGPSPNDLVAGGFGWLSRWDGATWVPIGTPMTGRVIALRALDIDGSGPLAPSLYAGGGFTRIGGVTIANIARWDGSAWSSLGTGANGNVESLAVHDLDGTSGPAAPSLIAGGRFSMVDGQSMQYLAAWNGANWSPVPIQTNSIVTLVESLEIPAFGGEPSLVLGGSFTAVNGISSERLAIVSCLTACPGDVNGDAGVDLQDLAVLLSNFGSLDGMQLENGDLDGDGDVDLSDLADLLAHFGANC